MDEKKGAMLQIEAIQESFHDGKSSQRNENLTGKSVERSKMWKRLVEAIKQNTDTSRDECAVDGKVRTEDL